ncbi:MAG: hypothetical protein CME95_06560 [Hyphomonadaceae bacterium]|jgi:hypothetical protein|nr:hypothetical protein [Hyphomonadaceae bacterium]|tara:strand:- start:386 stop:832 length:447 start_codon:yes stop_codon:yes gene_type:complete
MLAMWEQWTIQNWLQLGGLLTTLFGFLLVLIQIRRLGQSVRASAHAAIYAQASDFRSHLVKHPELRRYLFDGIEIRENHPDYQRVVTLAELLLNYLEHLSIEKSNFANHDGNAWRNFIKQALDACPVAKERLAENSVAYSPHLLAAID